MIAFVGSVFSPYYRRAWRQGRAHADDHCALNVALYSPGASRWTMTERGHLAVRRTRERLAIGPSEVRWRDGALEIDVDERACPLPRRVRGRVRVRPMALAGDVFALDDAARHRWSPIAPCARVEVAFDSPALSWSGHAYVDSNDGDEPISEPFRTWDWLRAPMPDGSTVVVYDVRQAGGGADRLIGRRFWPDGRAATVPVPRREALAPSGWRVERAVRSEAPAAVLRALEDTPFYARSVVRTRLLGHPVDAMHESLSATRFASPLVQAMLPFRMPRRTTVRSA